MAVESTGDAVPVAVVAAAAVSPAGRVPTLSSCVASVASCRSQSDKLRGYVKRFLFF